MVAALENIIIDSDLSADYDAAVVSLNKILMEKKKSVMKMSRIMDMLNAEDIAIANQMSRAGVVKILDHERRKRELSDSMSILKGTMSCIEVEIREINRVIGLLSGKNIPR